MCHVILFPRAEVTSDIIPTGMLFPCTVINFKMTRFYGQHDIVSRTLFKFKVEREKSHIKLVDDSGTKSHIYGLCGELKVEVLQICYSK